MDKYAVIGNPIEHSLSPKIHQLFARQAGIDISYEKIKAPLDDFKNTLIQFQKAGGKGCNITVPFKEEAFRLATTLDDNAKIAQSVNCIQFLDEGEIAGHNYDGAGLVEDLTKNKNLILSQQKILIVGAGGAARGIINPLLKAASSEITLTNRTFSKAQILAEHFKDHGKVNAIALNELPDTPYDLIINATAAGHHNQLPALKKTLTAKHTTCYDLSYGKAATPFLNWATACNCCQAYDGFGMLVEQAAASFYLWSDYYPTTHEIINSDFRQLK